MRELEVAFDRLQARVPAPRQVPFGPDNRWVFRYAEGTAQQAIIQKLARTLTGLRATLLLLKNGLVQEQAVMERILDEFREDVLFLTYGILKNQLDAPLHKSFLDAFYQEEFDNPGNPLSSSQKRPMVPRKRIQAYLAGVEGIVGNPSDNQEVARTMSKTYSGFVHGASPQIMDMYGGNPPRFHIQGMLGTPRMREYEHDIWNYFERGIATFALAAIAFRDIELADHLASEKRTFEVESGREAARGEGDC